MKFCHISLGSQFNKSGYELDSYKSLWTSLVLGMWKFTCQKQVRSKTENRKKISFECSVGLLIELFYILFIAYFLFKLRSAAVKSAPSLSDRGRCGCIIEENTLGIPIVLYFCGMCEFDCSYLTCLTSESGHILIL